MLPIVVSAGVVLVWLFWLSERMRGSLLRWLSIVYIAVTALMVLFATGQIGS